MSRNPRRQTQTPTISDVARRAGVSPMTVSRVINRGDKVREQTRRLVENAIAELNYAPNLAARSLAGSRHLRIGLLYSNPSAAYLSEFLVGSLDQASRSAVQLVVEKCDIGDHEVEVARKLVQGGIDGLILPPPLCDSVAVLAVLAAAGTPAVVVATGRPANGVLSVAIDDYAAALAMTDHILSLGHQRIGFISGNPNQTASGRRLEGYRAALVRAGVGVDPTLIAEGLFTYRSGLDAAEHLLDVADPPTAIFAANDEMAAATVAVAHRRGIDVPGDLTVCGFDDTTLATAIWPELTTIHQPIADMSRAALELLVATIREQRSAGDATDQVLDFTLIRRQSDATPRKRPRARLP